MRANGEEKEVTIVGSKGKIGEAKTVRIGAIDYSFFFGSKAFVLPFKVKLNDFIAQKYPGTEKSYSSFESKVTVQDPDETYDARIFMNNVLDHKGYRFFQSSFDPDEKGTVLSVNHDFSGTAITYAGYFMLFFAMMAIMFTKDSRFTDLKRKLEVVKTKKSKLITILVLMMSLSGFSQAHNHNHDENGDHADHIENGTHTRVAPTEKQLDSLLNKFQVKKEHAAKFGRLVIQDAGGRMKPINTFSSELLRKVSHSNSYKG